MRFRFYYSALLVSLIIFQCCQKELKEGYCYTEDSSICLPNVTKKQCAIYNKEKKDGHSWTLGEGCPVPEPQKPSKPN